MFDDLHSRFQEIISGAVVLKFCDSRPPKAKACCAGFGA